MKKFEPYNDDQFYKYFHQDTWWDYDYQVGGHEPSFFSVAAKRFQYKDYLASYHEAERQQALFKEQTGPLTETDFQSSKKRLLDLCTVKDPAERIIRQRRELIDTLCLNPYQRYRYADYIKMFQIVQEEDGRSEDSKLSEEEFLRFKRELLSSLRQRPVTESRIAREKQLRLVLFPGAYIR